jgi:hypothetical protein
MINDKTRAKKRPVMNESPSSKKYLHQVIAIAAGRVVDSMVSSTSKIAGLRQHTMYFCSILVTNNDVMISLQHGEYGVPDK